ncbi:dipeptidase [Aliikangiella sp. IMCC44653]
MIHYKNNALILPLVLLLFGCSKQSSDHPHGMTSASELSAPAASSRALKIAHSNIILDGHIDVPYRLKRKMADVSKLTEEGDFDFPRAEQGGLNAPFMSIYIPASLESSGGSYELANELIDLVESIVENAPDKFALAVSPQQVEDNFAKGLISLPLGMENGSPIEGDLEKLAHFYQRGIRYITLTHSKANHISDSSYDENRPAQGLTPFGKKLISAMNNMGIMIDVSHISDQAFYQVMELSKVPVIASHSSARHFTPGFERNMSDEMIKLLAEKGGVIQINFGSTFILQSSIENNNAYKAAVKNFLEKHQVSSNDPKTIAFSKSYREKIPFEYATLSDVLDHIDHVVAIAGIDAVGLGSDYDGVGDSLPVGLKDVSTYPALIDGLIARDYSENDIKKILSGNVLRVWKAVEAFSKQQQTVN